MTSREPDHAANHRKGTPERKGSGKARQKGYGGKWNRYVKVGVETAG